MIELIFEERCTSCGACETVCPTNVFDRDDSGRPVIARQEDCQTCFLCEAHCNADALFVAAWRFPHPAEREEVLALGVLGNFRKAVGFGEGATIGAFNYTGEYSSRDSYGPKNSKSPDAKIYAELAEAERRSLVDPAKRAPIDQIREIVI